MVGVPADNLAGHKSVFPLKKVKREAAAQRRPAKSERKKCFFRETTDRVWFETHSASN